MDVGKLGPKTKGPKDSVRIFFLSSATDLFTLIKTRGVSFYSILILITCLLFTKTSLVTYGMKSLGRLFNLCPEDLEALQLRSANLRLNKIITTRVQG